MSIADGSGFGHEAMLYDGRADFIRRSVSFIRDAINAKQPILVAVDRWKIDALRRSLGADAADVRFEDMVTIGRNPARIIPVWRAFMDDHAEVSPGARGIGEPIWAARSKDELVECERHEALLNLVFATPPNALQLMCPYDVGSLPVSVIEEARRNHPVVTQDGVSRPSSTYLDPDSSGQPFDAPLPDPVEVPVEMRFDEEHLSELRSFVRAQASGRGVAPARVPDLVLAVDETATNSIRYGGGSGSIRIWSQDQKVICEVSDLGVLRQPLAGRVRPDPTEPAGFGLWLANQMCDLVQMRTSPAGSSIRLHVDIA
ncbi:MAG: anti-sigma factor RsbA family regulatory protein [Actinomycetota bacterium]